MMESFFDAETDAYKFPFTILYQVGHYDENADEDINDSKFYEAFENEEFVMIDEKEKPDVIEEQGKKLKEFYKEYEDVFDNNSLEDTFRPSEAVSEATDIDSVEIINETPKTSARTSLIATPVKIKISNYSYEHGEDDKCSTCKATSTEPESEPKLDDVEFSYQSRATIIKMITSEPGMGNIIINNFRTFSNDEKAFIANKLYEATTIENFGDVLSCAEFWCYDDLTQTVVDHFIVKQDCEELLRSKEWAKLKNWENLYNYIGQLILTRSAKNDDNSPLAFFILLDRVVNRVSREIVL